MKLSRYIVTSKYDNNTLIYNMITGSLVLFTEKEYQKFRELFDMDENCISSDFDPMLIELGYIVPDNCNELQGLYISHWKEVFDKSSLTLTIIPTFMCNMNCVYCYQKGYQRNQQMNDTVYNSIYQFICHEADNRHLQNLDIMWFGGEPTLCLNEIIEFNNSIVSKCTCASIKCSISISTNLLNITNDEITKLWQSGVNTIMTTLAGAQVYHNKLRNSITNDDSFTKIVSNIREAAKYFAIMLSINLTTTNVNSCIELLNYLRNLDCYETLSVVFTRVESFNNNECEELCLSEDAYNKYSILLMNYCLDIGLRICDTTRFDKEFLFCPSDHANNYTIAPNGTVYKCAEKYVDETAIGRINSKGEIVLKSEQCAVCRDPYINPICKECRILPYCNGGCYGKICKGENYCPIEKDYLSDYLRVYYRNIVSTRNVE